MERDFFQRPARFTHRFGAAEERASACGTFEMAVPQRPDQRHTPGFSVQGQGAYCVHEGLSPIDTPNGRAATFGRDERVGSLEGGMPVLAVIGRRK